MSRLAVMIIMLLSGWTTCMADTQYNEQSIYTKENPLKIVCDVRSVPFEFRDDNGTPDGFCIEVIKEILNDINIPYTFIMVDKVNAVRTFESGEADLMLSPVDSLKPGIYYGKVNLASYDVAVAHKKERRSITDISQITPNEKVAIKQGEYSSEKVLSLELLDNTQINYGTVKQGLYGVAAGDYDYLICGKICIETIIKKYGITGLQVDRINIPAGKIKFAAHDPQLIEKLDERAELFQQAGSLQNFQEKWFNHYGDPEVKKEEPTLLIIAFTVCFTLAMFLIINRIVKKKIKKSMQHTHDINNILKTALELGNSFVLITDLKKGVISNLYGEIMPYGSITLDEFFERIHPDDQENVRNVYKDLLKMKDTPNYKFRWKSAIPNSKIKWKNIIGHSIIETDINGNPKNFITTISDVTKEEQEEYNERQTLEIYHHLFEMPLVGLALYDKNGFILEYNKEMGKVFGAYNSNVDFNANTCLFDMPSIRGNVDCNNPEDFHICTMTDFTNNGIIDYVEIKLRPIKDEHDELRYILMTAKDMEKQRNMYLQSKKHDAQIREISDEMQKYEIELTYLLEQSHMMVWRSNAEKRTVTLYRNLRAFYKRFTYDEFIKIVDSEYQALAKEFIEYDTPSDMAKKGILYLDDKIRNDGNKRFYAINSIPDYDKKGNKTGRFGLIRDTNDMMVAQEKMKQEKERANDSSRLKSVFLANMSHEIRTPLNAIVGFCDILQAIDDMGQRQEFLQIINNNCNMLLQLINDILILSELDSNGLNLNPEETDFAAKFNIITASLSSKVTNPNVKLITETPYKKLIVNIDMGRIQQVITNFLTNAVKYTQKGHIKLGYRLQDNGLYIYCEDTGAGIPKDKCDKVFGRFVKLNDYVQGAGLGLSICKAIIDRCEGKIAVDSEVGKGSTFWVWIPCEVKAKE